MQLSFRWLWLFRAPRLDLAPRRPHLLPDGLTRIPVELRSWAVVRIAGVWCVARRPGVIHVGVRVDEPCEVRAWNLFGRSRLTVDVPPWLEAAPVPGPSLRCEVPSDLMTRLPAPSPQPSLRPAPAPSFALGSGGPALPPALSPDCALRLLSQLDEP